MAALDESPPPPALQLITRSRSHGIEVVPAPSARDENQTLAVSAALGAKRSIAVASPGAGDWVALGGGNAPLEVAATRGGARATLLDDTAGCERFAFSPTGAHLVTWQRPNPEKFPDGSLRVWSLKPGAATLARSFHCKVLNRGGIPATIGWSGDERLAFHAVTNTIHVHDGAFQEKNGTDQVGSIKVENMSQLAASPIKTAPYACAAFVPEIKGRPAQVKLFAFPPPPDGAADGQVSAKAFYRAQDCKLSWSPGGHGVLVQTHTDVDATGGSYYGGTGLYLMQARPKKAGEPAFECLVPLPKEGPVAAAEWEPTKGLEFVVIAGTIPPTAALYNLEAEQIYAFGNAHRNVACWAPHGRFLALAGFGNLAGDVDFWDRHKKKKVGSANIPCAVTYGWSPDSRMFMAATLAPRMNVDNGVRVYRYDGSGPIATKNDRDPLYDCFWVPACADRFPDRGASAESKARAKALKATPAASKPQAYRPPGARGMAGGGSLASMIRAEREKDKGTSGGLKKQGQPRKEGLPVGAAPEPQQSRNAKRKEAARKRKEAEAAAAALEEATVAPPPPPAAAAADPLELSAEDLAKRVKKLKKQLKQIDELAAKVAGGLSPSSEQREKLDKKAAVAADLAAAEALL
mmetsp:Transcript_18115/g.53560  ORF Transcript_18115/g.53560 Transcript_18115/m.53560 type:complete len:634 (-) Transcript_18115:27-1928(-)